MLAVTGYDKDSYSILNIEDYAGLCPQDSEGEDDE